jgi:hypothetical protein
VPSRSIRERPRQAQQLESQRASDRSGRPINSILRMLEHNLPRLIEQVKSRVRHVARAGTSLGCRSPQFITNRHRQWPQAAARSATGTAFRTGFAGGANRKSQCDPSCFDARRQSISFSERTIGVSAPARAEACRFGDHKTGAPRLRAQSTGSANFGAATFEQLAHGPMHLEGSFAVEIGLQAGRYLPTEACEALQLRCCRS